METMHLSVRDGAIHDAGSWLYVWVPTGRGDVVYVGGTSLPPAVRTWLHLNHEDPAIARVAHRYPGAATESLEVLACRLPDEVDRREAKAELIRRLHDLELLAAGYVGDPAEPGEAPDPVRLSVDAVVAHLTTVL